MSKRWTETIKSPQAKPHVLLLHADPEMLLTLDKFVLQTHGLTATPVLYTQDKDAVLPNGTLAPKKLHQISAHHKKSEIHYGVRTIPHLRTILHTLKPAAVILDANDYAKSEGARDMHHAKKQLTEAIELLSKASRSLGNPTLKVILSETTSGVETQQGCILFPHEQSAALFAYLDEQLTQKTAHVIT